MQRSNLVVFKALEVSLSDCCAKRNRSRNRICFFRLFENLPVSREKVCMPLDYEMVLPEFYLDLSGSQSQIARYDHVSRQGDGLCEDHQLGVEVSAPGNNWLPLASRSCFDWRGVGEGAGVFVWVVFGVLWWV